MELPHLTGETMTLHEIEEQVAALPDSELAEFRDWFEELAMERWDRQIEADAEAGKLDFLADEVRREIAAGRTQPL